MKCRVAIKMHFHFKKKQAGWGVSDDMSLQDACLPIDMFKILPRQIEDETPLPQEKTIEQTRNAAIT